MSEASSRSFTVTSTDGVSLSATASGSGSSLALVYGALIDATSWARLVPCLENAFTLYTYDRRGRGASEDGATYEAGREVDDLMALLEALPPPVGVFGHSSGALLVLHAALKGAPVERMVLYEPPLLSLRRGAEDRHLPVRVNALIEQGDREAALELFLRDALRQPPEEVARLREGPRWGGLVGLVHTVVYDQKLTLEHEPAKEQLSGIQVPTLLLRGQQSPPWAGQCIEFLAEALPDAAVGVLEGQGHNPQFTAPDVLADAIRRFLA